MSTNNDSPDSDPENPLLSNDEWTGLPHGPPKCPCSLIITWATIFTLPITMIVLLMGAYLGIHNTCNTTASAWLIVNGFVGVLCTISLIHLIKKYGTVAFRKMTPLSKILMSVHFLWAIWLYFGFINIDGNSPADNGAICENVAHHWILVDFITSGFVCIVEFFVAWLLYKIF